MDALNQVLMCLRTKKLLSHLYDVTGRVAESVSNTERFGYISSLHYFKNDTIFLVEISHHNQVICVSMTIAQCQPHLCKADPSHAFQ